MYQYNRSCPCDRCRAKSFMGPAVLVTVGVLFLVATLTDGRFDFGRTWPVLLIVIGAVILAKRSASVAGHVDPTYPGYVPVQPVQAIEQYQAPQPPSGNEPQPPSSEVHNG